jgi:serine phosphatase RsbU (regulator of sigma subunit)
MQTVRLLVIFSDGITEAKNTSGEDFGETRLLHTGAVTPPRDDVFEIVPTP